MVSAIHVAAVRAWKLSVSICRWFGRGWWYWLAVALLVAVIVLLVWNRALLDCKERDIRLFGLILQVLGFMIVVRGLHEVGRYFDKPSAMAQARKYFSEFPLRRRDAIVGTGLGMAVGSSFARGRGRAIPAPGSSIELRVELLERTVTSLDSEVGQLDAAHHELKTNTEQALKKEAEERSRATAELKQSLDTAIAGGVYLERLGVGYFVIGIVLATAAPEIASLTWLGGEFSCSRSLWG